MDNEPDCRNCRNKQRYRPNSFFVGDTYYYTYENGKQSVYKIYDKGGATVGANASGARATDLYHIAMNSVAVYPKDLGTATAVQRLWDGVWYERAFKNPDAFTIESQLASGYYPRINMSDSMETAQENIALPPAPCRCSGICQQPCGQPDK